MRENLYIIDCDSKILGRLASHAAKLLLLGNKVVLINAEKAAISGHVSSIASDYKQKIELQDKANPEHSPYISRRPDLFVRRVVRGMLPYKKAKGREAYKRLRVYVGIPSGIDKKNIEEIKVKDRKETYESAITVKELSERLGYKVS
jgi:large subunit ribosomal protein L13